MSASPTLHLPTGIRGACGARLDACLRGHRMVKRALNGPRQLRKRDDMSGKAGKTPPMSGGIWA